MSNQASWKIIARKPGCWPWSRPMGMGHLPCYAHGPKVRKQWQQPTSWPVRISEAAAGCYNTLKAQTSCAKAQVWMMWNAWVAGIFSQMLIEHWLKLFLFLLLGDLGVHVLENVAVQDRRVLNQGGLLHWFPIRNLRTWDLGVQMSPTPKFLLKKSFWGN